MAQGKQLNLYSVLGGNKVMRAEKPGPSLRAQDVAQPPSRAKLKQAPARDPGHRNTALCLRGPRNSSERGKLPVKDQPDGVVRENILNQQEKQPTR